jgi:hypothetical protein
VLVLGARRHLTSVSGSSHAVDTSVTSLVAEYRATGIYADFVPDGGAPVGPRDTPPVERILAIRQFRQRSIIA